MATTRTAPPTHGSEATREAAMAAFAKSWRREELLVPRQPHRKDRTLAGLARHNHVAAHHAREFAADGKPEARAAKTPGSERIGLSKFREQLRLLLGCHADPSVVDRKLDPAATVGDLSRGQPDHA